MRQALMEGLDLAQQLVALPFKASRQLFRETGMARRPLGEVITESLTIGEDLTKLPFKAAAALLSEVSSSGPSLEERVAALEQQVGIQPPTPTNADAPPEAVPAESSL
jgi:hypothetical protein